MKKRTTYNRPSIVDQIKAGRGTYEEVKAGIEKLKQDGASPKTIRKAEKAMEERVW